MIHSTTIKVSKQEQEKEKSPCWWKKEKSLFRFEDTRWIFLASKDIWAVFFYNSLVSEMLLYSKNVKYARIIVFLTFISSPNRFTLVFAYFLVYKKLNIFKFWKCCNSVLCGRIALKFLPSLLNIFIYGMSEAFSATMFIKKNIELLVQN